VDTSFVWDQGFATGLNVVDRQHHALVDLLNEVSQAQFSPGGCSAQLLAGIYQRLLAYTEYHFGAEEELMVRGGLDARHIETHRAQHRQFVQEVTQRVARADAGAALLDFLTSWLVLHILGTDHSMARQMEAIGRGDSPGQAYEREHEVRDDGLRALLKTVSKLYAALLVQNAQLAGANQHLEERVAQRTRELEQANERLRTLSRTDALLDIANRAYFDEWVEQACAQARRAQAPVGLIMIDIDHFKPYNDRYGHQQGDACLQAVARAVRGCTHRGADLVARYGGEELVVVLPETDAAGALAVARHMVQAVSDLAMPNPDAPPALRVTISAGVCSMTPPPGQEGSGSAELIARADAALYQAKNQGRNRCVAAA
jgi:hemerythrin